MATSKRAPVTQDHSAKETLAVDYNTPGHAARGAATALFSRTRIALIEREHGRCWLSGQTAAQSGAPLEAHHYPVERSFAERWDWARFAKDCQAGHWGPYAQGFDWVDFFACAVTIIAEDTGKPYLKVRDPYVFVDDMRVNGRLLAKKYHTGPDEGIHCLPEPIYFAQKYLAEGYRFSPTEVIHHQDQTMTTTPAPEAPEKDPAPAQSDPAPVNDSDVGNGDPPKP